MGAGDRPRAGAAREPGEIEARARELLDTGRLTDAATLIVRGYGPGILGYLGSVLRDDSAATDAFSEFSEELWRSLPRYAGKSSVKTWAYSIAYHCALRDRRARARRKTRPLRDSELSRIERTARTLSRSFSRTAAERKLDALRAMLSEQEQTILVLRLDRDMSWQDIAQVLAGDEPLTAAGVRKRFQRIKERLRLAAEREGLLPKNGDE